MLLYTGVTIRVPEFVVAPPLISRHSLCIQVTQLESRQSRMQDPESFQNPVTPLIGFPSAMISPDEFQFSVLLS